MKRSLNKYFLQLTFILMVCSLTTIRCKQENNEKSAEQTVYTCPMHPEIIRKEKGKCPICHMDLVPLSAIDPKADSVQIEMLLKPTNGYVISNIETIKLTQNSNQNSMEVNGIIAYDERLSNSVSARVNARIEKLFVKYNYQKITTGQRLFDLYSPELQNEQQNFIFLLTTLCH